MFCQVEQELFYLFLVAILTPRDSTTISCPTTTSWSGRFPTSPRSSPLNSSSSSPSWSPWWGSNDQLYIQFSSNCEPVEPEEPDHDDQPVGGAVLERLQAAVGPGGVRRSQHAPRPLRPHLETRHRPLQQVTQNRYLVEYLVNLYSVKLVRIKSRLQSKNIK